MRSLSQQLEVHEDRLSILLRSFIAVWGYQVELDSATRGKNFRVRNERVWHAMIAHRDMVVQDLASWAAALWERKQFFDELNEGDFTVLGRERKNLDSDNDEYWRRWATNVREGAFDRLFPNRFRCGGKWPTRQDIKDLKERLKTESSRVKDQRDARAHIYDGEDFANVKNLNFSELELVFTSCGGIIRDLRTLVGGAGEPFRDVQRPSEDRFARSMVDLVLSMDVQFAVEQWIAAATVRDEFLWQCRSRFYERVHELHDAFGNPEILFNDLSLEGPDMYEAHRGARASFLRVLDAVTTRPPLDVDAP